MADQFKPGTGSEPADYTVGSLDIDDNQSVSFYASQPSQYPVENLEVRDPNAAKQAAQMTHPVSTGFKLSRRKAMVVSVVITLIVILLTTLTMLFVVRSGSDEESSKLPKQQDITLTDAEDSEIPSELQGEEQSLLINGDIVTRGSIKVSDGSTVTILRVEQGGEDQTITLPNGSGIVCLNTNNCGYASLLQFNSLQDQVGALQGQVAEINTLIEEIDAKIPPAGVDTLNGQRGAVSIQGSLNRVSVSTSNGVITVATPQNLDANANVQFGSLTISQAGTIRANTLMQTGAGNSININANNDLITFTAGGRVFQFPNAGSGTQTICTSDAACAGGSGDAVLLAPGAAQQDATADASIFINDTAGGNLIQLQSAGVNRLTVANNGNTTINGSLTVAGLGNGFVRSTGGTLSVVAAIGLASSDVTGVLPVTNGGTGTNTIPMNGVVIGNGVNPVATAVAGAPGLCLVSTAGAPSFQACPGVGSSFNLTADAGSSEQVDSGDTVTISGGNNVTTTVGSTDTVTIDTVNNPTFSTSVSTPLLQSSGALSITPGGALTVGSTSQTALLQGSTTTITSTGAGNDIVLTSADQVRLSGFNCTGFSNGGKLTTDASGNISCANDNGALGGTITGSGNANRLAMFTGSNTVADSWLLQNGSTLELDNSRNLSLTGGNFSVVGTGLFSGLLTANGGLTIEAGDTFTFNGEAFTDLTGTGLSFNSGSLQTTLGTSVDLTSEVTGVLPVTNGGTGVNGSGATNGQLLIGNGSGYTLATLTQGSGITITNGAGSISVASTLGASVESAEITDLTITNLDIANGTIDLTTKTTGNYVAGITGSSQVSVSGSGSNNAAVTLGLISDSIGDTQLAFNTGQHLTTASAPSFAGLTITGGTFNIGTVTQLASLVLHDGNGQTTTLQPGNSSGNLTFTLPSADGLANQCVKTNASGVLSFGNCLADVGSGGGVTGSGSQDRLSKFDASGTNLVDSTISDNGTNVTTSVDLVVQGGGLTVGTALQDAALTLYGNGYAANIVTAALTGPQSYTLPDGSGEFCIKEMSNCSGSGGGNAPVDAQYLTLALNGGLSAERTLSFNGTNFGVVDGGANGSYTVNTAQDIDTAAAPEFAGLELNGNLVLNANTIQGGTAVIDFTNFDVSSTGVVTAGTYNGQTISSAASLTGTLAVAGLTTLNGGLTVEAGDTLTFNGEAFTDLTGNGLQVSGNALTLLVQANKGLEADASGLSLIDCTDGQVLKYNGSNQWACAADAGGSGVGDDVRVNGVDADGANFINTAVSGSVAGVTFGLNNVTNPDEVSLTVSVASATEAGVITTGAQTFAGVKTFNGQIVASGGVSVGASQNLTINGDSVQDLTGNGLQVQSNALTLLVQANKGLEVDGSGLSLVDCTDGQILKYNGSNQWACAADAGGSGLGDDVYVNGVALTNADFLNTVASATNVATTWSVNAANPDEITLSLGAASATDAGIVTANAQTFGGVKTFNSQIAASGGVALGTQTLSGTTAAINFDNFDVLSNGNTTVGGTLTVSGTSTFNDDITVAAGQSLTLTGGNTGSRPGAPTEGMLYYDTDTKRLLVYANGKWQADRSEAVLVAANNSSQADKDAADYVADGTDDQVQINQALTAADPASGTRKTGKVYLFAGTYTVHRTDNGNATIRMPNNTTLTGAGQGTVITMGSTVDATDNLIENIDTTTGTGITIRDIRLEGQKAQQTGSIDQHGIYLNGLGGGVGCAVGTLAGAYINNVTINDFEDDGLYLNNTSNSLITSSTFINNGANGFMANGCLASINTITANLAQYNGNDGFSVSAGFNNVISSNVAFDNANAGFSITNASNSNNIMNNNARGNDTYGIYVHISQYNVISNNNIRGGSTYGIYLVDNGVDGSNKNTISNNNIFDTGGATTNNAIYLDDSDANNITGNVIDDTSASTNNFAINIANAGADDNFVSSNMLTTGSINDLSGGTTVYGGQTNASGNFMIQPAGSGTIELMKTTNITGDLNVTGNIDTNGSLTVGNANQFVISNTGVVTSGTWQGTAIVDTYVADNITISSAGTVDWQALSNYPAACPAGQALTQLGDTVTCTAFAAGSGSGNYIQNQNASAQTTADFWISGIGRADTRFITPAISSGSGDLAINPGPGATLNLATVNGSAVNISQSGAATTINGSLTVNQAATFNGNVTIAANRSLTVTGSNTASRPISPTEGMVYYDTDTDKLLVYSNGKWQADRSEAVLVAASNSSQADRDAADYVANGDTGAAGDGDQVEINTALAAAAGKKVVILAGTYTIDGRVDIPNNTTFAGTGKGSKIILANSTSLGAGQQPAIQNLTGGGAGAGIVVRDMYLDGNRTNQAGNPHTGLRVNGAGSVNGASSTTGALIDNVTFASWRGTGFSTISSYNVRVTNSTFIDNTNALGSGNVNLNATSGSTVSGNTIIGGNEGVSLSGATANTISDNTFTDTVSGIVFRSGSSSNVISGNILTNTGGTNFNNAITLLSAGGDSNQIIGNSITDSSATTSNYAISIASSNNTNYLADNTLGGGSIDDAGTGTIYGGQTNAAGNYLVQPAGTVELMKNTNVTGALSVSGASTFTGQATFDGGLRISDASSNYATITVGPLAGNYSVTIPTITANDTFCLASLGNCGYDGGDFIQNQNASAQTTANFWISGNGRVDGDFRADGIVFTDEVDVFTPGSLLRIGDGASGITMGSSGVDTTFNGSVVLASFMSLTINGAGTGSRPPTPTEGTVFYDTDTKQLITYANGKWQADRGDAVYVAASNSSQSDRDRADYVTNGDTAAAGDGDQIEINNALTAAAGKKVILLAGTYTADETILVPNNTTLSGVGNGTVIEWADIDVIDNLIENSDTSTGTGVTIREMKLDGRSDLNSSAQNGIWLSSMGNTSPARSGATLTNLEITRFTADAIYINNGANNNITNNNIHTNTTFGISLNTTAYNRVSGNNLNGHTSGIYVYAGTANTITNNNSRGTDYGIYVHTSSGNTISGNSAYGSSNGVIVIFSSSNTITGNTVEGGGALGGIALGGAGNSNIATGNTILNTGVGIAVLGSFNTVSGNTISTTSSDGIRVSASDNVIANNTITDAGGAAHNNAIFISNAHNNQITGNYVSGTSATTTNYAINIQSASGSANTYLSNNRLASGTVNVAAGNNVIYGGQTSNSGNYLIQALGSIQLMNSTGVTGALAVSGDFDTEGSLTVGNANQFVINNTGVVTSGTWQGSTIGLGYGGTNNTTYTTNGVVYNNGSALVSTGAGTNGQCLLATTGGAPSWGTCTPTSLQGTYDASSPANILLSNNKDFTINTNDTATDSSIIFNLSCATCSANGGRFAVQDAGVDVFTVMPNGDIRLGTAANNMTLGASTGYKPVLSGTARNAKTIRLSAEYPGAVLTADLTNNLGTMTSDYDQTNRMNYYNWTTTQVTPSQGHDYDIVVQVPIPSDFDGWASNPLAMTGYTTDATNGIVSVQVMKSNGSADSNFATFQPLTLTPINNWQTHVFTALDSANYTAGDYLTLRIKMQAPNAGNTRVGNIVLNYLSKF